MYIEIISKETSLLLDINNINYISFESYEKPVCNIVGCIRINIGNNINIEPLYYESQLEYSKEKDRLINVLKSKEKERRELDFV